MGIEEHWRRLRSDYHNRVKLQRGGGGGGGLKEPPGG